MSRNPSAGPIKFRPSCRPLEGRDGQARRGSACLAEAVGGSIRAGLGTRSCSPDLALVGASSGRAFWPPAPGGPTGGLGRKANKRAISPIRRPRWSASSLIAPSTCCAAHCSAGRWGPICIIKRGLAGAPVFVLRPGAKLWAPFSPSPGERESDRLLGLRARAKTNLLWQTYLLSAPPAAGPRL